MSLFNTCVTNALYEVYFSFLSVNNGITCRPTRWDEWVSISSPRIAPFRTRTLHSGGLPHSSPSPVAIPSHAPSTSLPDPLAYSPLLASPSAASRMHPPAFDLTDEIEAEAQEGKATEGKPTATAAAAEVKQSGDSSVATGTGEEAGEEEVVDEGTRNIRSLLPTLSKMMHALLPAVDAAAEEVVRGSSSRRSSRPRPGPSESSSSSSSSSSGDRLRSLAEELCPLADRFGRILTDMSPLLNKLALPPGGTSAAAEEAAAQPVDQGPLSLLEMSLASLLRPR
jgi:hypothetical protein